MFVFQPGCLFSWGSPKSAFSSQRPLASPLRGARGRRCPRPFLLLASVKGLVTGECAVGGRPAARRGSWVYTGWWVRWRLGRALLLSVATPVSRPSAGRVSGPEGSGGPCLISPGGPGFSSPAVAFTRVLCRRCSTLPGPLDELCPAQVRPGPCGRRQVATKHPPTRKVGPASNFGALQPPPGSSLGFASPWGSPFPHSSRRSAPEDNCPAGTGGTGTLWVENTRPDGSF